MISPETKQTLYQIAYVENNADHYEQDSFFGDHALIVLNSAEKQELGVDFDACIIFRDTLQVDVVHLNQS